MNCIIIGIAGGSGSGKSTFTNRLKEYFKDDITVIYHDNYYKRQYVPFEERVKVNYDHPNSLETDLLLEHLKELKRGNSIMCPVYDFAAHNRSDQVICIEPKKVIIVEGILLFQNDDLRNLLDYKIYVDSDADERILRRILRDVEERGRDLQGIVDQYLTTVKPMHNLYVEPTKYYADIILNSGRNNVAFEMVKDKINLLLNEKK